MNYQYLSRKCTVRDDVKNYTEKKFAKLDKFFDGECTMHVIYTYEKEDLFKVEATVTYNGIIFRAQAEGADFKYCIDELVDIIVRQIRKHKTKLQKQLKKRDIFDSSDAPDMTEDDYKIVRKKAFTVKPMSDDEAILQMNMLGHDFFVYRNEEQRLCIIYKRKHGDYGLIEAD